MTWLIVVIASACLLLVLWKRAPFLYLNYMRWKFEARQAETRNAAMRVAAEHPDWCVECGACGNLTPWMLVPSEMGASRDGVVKLDLCVYCRTTLPQQD